jgi:addiction module RelE/StbE family toxin|tara:strand:- start:345 stop:596 length:252 start_codon:yes stop_codon:yes gene_type:complete
MYKIITKSRKAEKQFYQYVDDKLSEKLDVLRENPRGKLGAHKLKGKYKGLWSCWLASNLRMVYEIDDVNEEIVVFSVGSHKVY